MEFVRRWVLVVFLSLIALNLYASPASPEVDVDYTILSTPQPTNTGKKVEVIEFFGYFCGYCYTFDTPLANWARKNSDRVVFRREAVGFNEGTRLQQRLFYTLAAMNKLTHQMHQKVFQAVQEGHIRLRSDSQVFDFAARLGVDRNTFSDVYQSSSIQELTKNAEKMQDLYKINGVPMIIVDGKYATSPATVADGNKLNSDAEIYAATFKVMDWLVDQAYKNPGAAKKIKPGKN